MEGSNAILQKTIIERLNNENDNIEEIRLIVARLEVSVSQAQVKFYETMGEIRDAIKDLAGVSLDIKKLQNQMELSSKDRMELRRKEEELAKNLIEINDNVVRIKVLEQELKSAKNNFFWNVIFVILLFLLLIFHIVVT